MKKICWSSWMMTLCVLVFGCSDSSKAADQTTANNLGHLYYMVNPLNVMQHPGDVEDFIRENKSLLQSDSPIIQCAKKLGNKLTMSGLNSFSTTDYDRAYGSVLSMGGDTSQARSVADSLQQGAVDAYMVGQELLWIADAVPKAANGDWSAFNTTGTQSRKTMRQVWPLYQQLGMQSVLDQYKPLFQPMIEEQVKFLALMLLN